MAGGAGASVSPPSSLRRSPLPQCRPRRSAAKPCAGAVGAGTRRRTACRRTHAGPARRRGGGDVSRRRVPLPRPPRGTARPARLGADRRPGARPRPRLPRTCRPSSSAGSPPSCSAYTFLARRSPRRCRCSRRRTAGRLPTRSSTSPTTRSGVAAPGDRVGPVPPAARHGGEAVAARAAVDRRSVRGVPAPVVPGPEAVLDRGAGRARAHARRVDRARGAPGRSRGRHGHGAPRAPQRACAHAGPAVRGDPPRVRRRAGAERGRRQSRGRHRRREVPPRGGRGSRDRGGPDRHHARLQPEPPRSR